MKMIQKMLPVAAGAFLLLAGCRDASDNARETVVTKAQVIDQGKTVVFPPGSPGLALIKTIPVKRSTAMVSVIAPARVVASIIEGQSKDTRTIIFDSPDITSLYSQFRQARTSVERTGKALSRVKEMYDAQGATARDLTEAQTDAATSGAQLAESEGKLRTAGFNPAELDASAPGTVWLISDVSESQLSDVQKGEEVDVFFSSYPDKKFVGHAVTVGDVVDPITRTVKVRVVMKNPFGRFLPGMFAKVDFGDPIENVIVVPPEAVVTVEGKDYSFVGDASGRFFRREIAVSKSTDKIVVVAHGLEDNEAVVVDGAMLLKGLSFGY